MSRLDRAVPRSSGVLLLPAASVAVHQARYWLAYGSRANAELAAQGHSYFHSLVPWSILALGLGAGLFLRRAARVMRTGTAAHVGRRSTAAIWLATWGVLVAIYAIQETLEALFSTGHPGGWAAVLGHGGWWAIPVAAAIASVVTALLRLGRAILLVAATDPRRFQLVASTSVRTPAGVAAAIRRPLASAAAGRAPPARLQFG
jgi:hypothetical protein